MLESGDAAPAETLRTAATDACQALSHALASWRQLNGEKVAALNATLAKLKLKALPLATDIPPSPTCEPR
jgi:hypothetical protein